MRNFVSKGQKIPSWDNLVDFVLGAFFFFLFSFVCFCSLPRFWIWLIMDMLRL